MRAAVAGAVAWPSAVPAGGEPAMFPGLQRPARG